MFGLKVDPQKWNFNCMDFRKINCNCCFSSVELEREAFGSARYLLSWFALLPGKLSLKDFRALSYGITIRIRGWTCKRLTYAGRSKLIKSVIQSIASYSNNVFILPNKVMHMIEQQCSAFLWHCLNPITMGAKFKWEDVCLLKREGGLGVKNLSRWNSTCITKFWWLNQCLYRLKDDNLWIVKTILRVNSGEDHWRWFCHLF